MNLKTVGQVLAERIEFGDKEDFDQSIAILLDCEPTEDLDALLKAMRIRREKLTLQVPKPRIEIWCLNALITKFCHLNEYIRFCKAIPLNLEEWTASEDNPYIQRRLIELRKEAAQKK